MERRVFEQRREKARSLMCQMGLDSLLVQHGANRYYLSGFELNDPQPNESSGWLILMEDGRDWLCTDARYLEAAKRLWDEDRIFIYYGNAAEQVNSLLKGRVSSLGFDSRYMSLSVFGHFDESLGFQQCDGLIESLRIKKEPEEIALMVKSCAINEKMMQWLPTALIPGKSEKAVSWEIEQFFRNNGAEGLAFSNIVAVDANGALPHAIPGNTLITENCSVLVDVGCRYSSYCSDQTRTFWVGNKPSDAFLKNLEYVQQAQKAGLKALKPGAQVADVYMEAKKSLETHGVAEYFTHGLGHGVGLETHEAPSLSPLRETILEPGMVVTVEPGVYYSGEFGIRWEHMAVITEDGYRIL